MKRANKGLSLEESIRKYLKSVPLNANKSSFLVDTAINSMSFDLGMAGSRYIPYVVDSFYGSTFRGMSCKHCISPDNNNYIF